MLNPDFLQTNHFAPPGMIPAFNELGNHPTNMKEYVRTQLSHTLGRLGIEEKYSDAESVLLDGVDELLDKPSQFTGRHMSCAATRPIQDFLQETFVRLDQCALRGANNYEAALDLMDSGKNVILAPNHTSPLDGLIPGTIFHNKYTDVEQPRLVMSQVFEYARITRLLTSGVDKYPVFQPKHMRRFVANGQPDVAASMRGQNSVTMRAFYEDMRMGGRNVFLYLERDRNTDGMGVPEPAAARVLELAGRAKPDLHLLPMYISGAETIFPSRKGVNEVDEFMQTVQIGQGTVTCGEPIPFSELREMSDTIDQRAVVEHVMGNDEELLQDPKRRRLATMAITILGRIADMAPSEAEKGVYKDLK